MLTESHNLTNYQGEALMHLLSTVRAAEARLRARGQLITTTTAAQPNCLCDPQRSGLCSKCKGES